MILLKIFDIKDLMTQLLLKDSFDEYLLEEAQVTTYAKLSLSGIRNMEWFDEYQDSEQKLPQRLYWKEAKGIILQYIKGKKTPDSFYITLKATQKQAEKLFENQKMYDKMLEQRTELLLHFRFEKGELCVISGISQKEFVMDKQVEFAWDEILKRYMKGLKLSYEEA